MSTWCAAAAAEGKYTDDGSGGGNGTAYGILAATSLAVAVTLAVAPHTVGCQASCLWPDAHALNRMFRPCVLSMHLCGGLCVQSEHTTMLGGLSSPVMVACVYSQHACCALVMQHVPGSSLLSGHFVINSTLLHSSSAKHFCHVACTFVCAGSCC